MKKLSKILIATLLIGTQLFAPLQTVFAEEEKEYVATNSSRLEVGSEICTDVDGKYAEDDTRPDTYVWVVLSDDTVALGFTPYQYSLSTTVLNIPSHVSDQRGNQYTVTQLNYNGKNIGGVSYAADFDGFTKTTLPDTVTEIPEGFFANGKDLKEIIIPDSITKIGESAFSSCSALESITIPGSVKTIEHNTFFGCTNLKTVKLEEGVETIGESAFNGLTALTTITIPNSVTTICKSAFQNSGLTSIRLPNSLNKIEENAFLGCEGLETIIFPAEIETIGKSAFSNCFSLTSIEIPTGTETIEEMAFQNCYNIKEIIIPSTVTKIENRAFQLDIYKGPQSQLEKVRINGNGNNLTIENADDANFKHQNKTKISGLKFEVDKDFAKNNSTLLTLLKGCVENENEDIVYSELPKIQFKLNNQNFGDPVDYDLNAGTGNQYTLPDLVTQGWYNVGTPEKVNDSLYTVNLTEKEFTISYQGMDNASLDDGITNLDKFTFSTPKTNLNNPKKDTYKFVGWQDVGGNIVTSIHPTKAENLTLTATWEKVLNEINAIQAVDKVGKQLNLNGATNQDVTVTVNFARDETGWKHYYQISNVANANWQELPDDYKITLTNEGKYVLKFQSQYENETAISQPVSYIFTIDRQKPIVYINDTENYFGTKINGVTDSVATENSGVKQLTINGEKQDSYILNILGPVDKDTGYEIVIEDYAGNTNTYQYTLKALPSVDDITINDLALIGNIQSELEGKITNDFFKDTDADLTSIKAKVKALETRYNKLIALADVDDLMAAAKTATKENINSGTAKILKTINESLTAKFNKLNEKPDKNDGEKEAVESIQAEINRIKDMLSYHKEVMKNYDTVLANANALSKLEVTLGNVTNANEQLTDISNFIDTHKQNLTGEEVVALTTLTSKVNSEFAELSKAQNELSSLLNIAKNLDSSLYIKASVDKLNKAIENANSVLKEESTTLDDLTKTLDILNEAIDGLEKVVTEPTTPDDPNQSNKPTTPVNPEHPNKPTTLETPKDGGKAVKTGDATRTTELFALMGLAVFIIGAMRAKRKTNL